MKAPGRPYTDESEYETTLVNLFIQLAHHKRLIATLTGAASLAGIILSFLLPVTYRATTKIMPPQQAPSSTTMLMNQISTGTSGSMASLAGGALALRNPNAIYIGILSSRPIADAIIRRFDLKNVYKAKDMTAARTTLALNTEIASEKEGFISVSVIDANQERVAAIANAYADELRNLTQSLSASEAFQRRVFYEEQLRQSKEALVNAEVQFQNIQQMNGLIQLDAQATSIIERLALLQAQIAAKQVALQTMRSYSTEHNPEVALAQRELRSLQGEAARLERRNHSSDLSHVGLGDIPSAGMEYLRAEHELKYRQAIFDLLIKQFDGAKLDEAKQAAIIQVLEPAIKPDRKLSPMRGKIIAMSTVAGFILSSVFVLIMWWNKKIQSNTGYAERIQVLMSAITE